VKLDNGMVHAKSGNLNNTIAPSKSDFIAIFDADHAPKKIPHPNFGILMRHILHPTLHPLNLMLQAVLL
jgi:hypothetical protein